MQLTKPPATVDEVWNWQANVVAGIADFETKLYSVKTIARPADENFIETMLGKLPAGRTYKAVNDCYTGDMFVQDAVQAYNGYFAWQPSTKLSDYYPDQNGVVTVKWVRTPRRVLRDTGLGEHHH